jgi:hypothetical protein
MTSCWFAKLPPGHTGVSISRGNPRGQTGYKSYRALAPGNWFRSVSPPQYLKLYNEILAALDPRRVVEDLEALGPNPTILCWERIKDIESGHTYCHRHVAAQWLEDTLGIRVEEVGFPHLKRWEYLRCQRIEPPHYQPAPTNLLDDLARFP